MKKSVLSLLLAFMLVVGLLPVNALADQTERAGSADRLAAPTSITVEYAGTRKTPDGKLIGKTGDAFQFRAVDQGGNETPVTWKNGSTWAGSLDENGLFTAGSLSSGGSTSLYINAVSTLDESVKSEGRFDLCGFQMSQYQKTPAVALSEDGQTAKTISTSGGYNGSTVWTYEGAEGIARLSGDQDLSAKKTSIKFDALRPGTFTASFTLDFDETMTDTATLTITGVAVEDPSGVQGKTYLTLSAAAPDPTVALTAYLEPGHTVASWSSSDEAVATVDETGLVTARGVGTALITATDDQGKKGGIKVVVQSGETPYFENLQFMTSALSDWNANTTFSATKLEYPLTIRAYSTTKLTLQATTLYDSGKYAAVAEYTGGSGDRRSVEVNSGKITYLEDIPFDASTLTITLADKADPENKTVYTFHVTRPRDSTQTLNTRNGVVLQPEGRALSATKYKEQAEGTLFQLDENDEFVLGWNSKPSTGLTASRTSYRLYALSDVSAFSLNLTGATVYEHLRWSADGGATWTELPQGGGTTGVIPFPAKTGEDAPVAEVRVHIVSDKDYVSNANAFPAEGGATYRFLIEQASSSPSDAQILTAETESGDWYPVFSPDTYSYTLSLPNGAELPTLRYTAAQGAAVKLGSTEQTPDDQGVYTLPLKSTSQTLTVTAADGSVTNSYAFQAKNRTAGGADRVVDYLCINSQYTNGGYGSNPQSSLAGSHISLGNFGGYVTYYFDSALTDDPAHRYGVDFYINGNANVDGSTPTKTSFFEPGQVYVSEDGETWYALAGSAHYEDGVDWNYTVTYSRAASGKTAWTDSHGNSNAGASYTGPWPNSATYFLNGLPAQDRIVLSGVALPARSGDIAVSGQAVDAYPSRWGYADCQVNGTENPYLDNSNYDLAASGFDLAWAVDENGLPVDVSGREFHYVKIQTASNIWHTSFGDKSPEIAKVTRAEEEAAVGETALPAGVTVTNGAEKRSVMFTPERRVYDLDLGEMKYVSLSVDGAAADDNIYLNNTRVSAGAALEGLKVTKESGPRLVRVLVQNGDKEPVICLLRLTSSASASDELLEDIKLNVAGSARTAQTSDGAVYTASVGYRIAAVGIVPVADPEVSITVNGAAPQAEYPLAEGENTFTLTAEKDGQTQSVTLRVTREAAPVSTGTVTVYFTLLGDTAHGEDTVHTLSGGGLTPWISQTAYTLTAPATVLDVLEAALGNEHTFVNADGNYISEIDGLAEFTNGPRSGWMYTLNEAYPGKGVAEQSVKDGDRVVFHYTDDYTLERSAEDWGGSSYDPGEEPSGGFKDIAGHWAEDDINRAVELGLFRGTSATAFSPNVTLNRAMMTQVLYNLEKPDGTYEDLFGDVKDGQWYAEAIAWAGDSGVVEGVGQNRFAPLRSVTRQEMAVMLYRYAKSLGLDVSAEGDLSAFTDGGKVADWAQEAMLWAVERGIFTGKGHGNLDPAGNATRAESVTVMLRLKELVGR